MIRPEKVGLRVLYVVVGVFDLYHIRSGESLKSFKPENGINRIIFSIETSEGRMQMDYTEGP